jgi:hypothetical protein
MPVFLGCITTCQLERDASADSVQYQTLEFKRHPALPTLTTIVLHTFLSTNLQGLPGTWQRLQSMRPHHHLTLSYYPDPRYRQRNHRRVALKILELSMAEGRIRRQFSRCDLPFA